MKIVVARYNEDISWTTQFPNVIIYNKGLPMENYSNQIMLPNLGREGQTYYKHIVENYHTLDDYTVFLQGNPFDHSPNVLLKLNQYIQSPPIKDFEYISEQIYKTNLSGCPHHSNLPMQQVYAILFQENRSEMEIEFGAGAQFIVSRKAIQSNPIEFYQLILQFLEQSIDPIVGHVFERFHRIIFTRNL